MSLVISHDNRINIACGDFNYNKHCSTDDDYSDQHNRGCAHYPLFDASWKYYYLCNHRSRGDHDCNFDGAHNFDHDSSWTGDHDSWANHYYFC